MQVLVLGDTCAGWGLMFAMLLPDGQATIIGYQHQHLHAFPAADHPASNAVCRKAGFTLCGETGFEYPPGTIMRCNDWRLEL